MRWIKKEFDEDGKPEWVVYIDEAGYGKEEDWSHFDAYASRDEAVKACWNYTWEDYDKRDK